MEIEELRAVFNAASSGLWEINGHCVMADNNDPESMDEYDELIVADCSDDPKSEEHAETDARFISISHNHFAALLDIAEVARACLARDDIADDELGKSIYRALVALGEIK